MKILPGETMSIDDEMTIDERRKYLRKRQKRYAKADRVEKGALLDEMEQVTGLHRKYLIQLLAGDLKRKPRRKQRGSVYGPEIDDALRVIDESYDYICAERLTPNLVEMAEQLSNHGELEAPDLPLEKLRQISISTVGRILERTRQDEPRLPRRKAPKRPKLTQSISMKRIPWDIATPGHFEVDLVHHSGSTASGEYMCTLQMVDVATGWSERVAVLGRSFVVMKHAFQTILRRLPFPVLEIHSDNGGEFLNSHMFRLWGDTVKGVTLSRSRPYQKNDNRNVEQKNSTLVRAYLGFERFDSVAQTLAANQLFEMMWIYYNLFQPVMHLVEKHVVQEDGQPVRIRRRHAD
jgi:transposase InsO family protein